MTTKIRIMFVIAAALAAGIAALWPAGFVRPVQAHCQMPCGIYDDSARVQQLREDAATIAKAVELINSLTGKTDPTSTNQLLRWVNTKEEHASHIMTTVSEYFLAQRVQLATQGSDGYAAYLKNLADHHAVIVMAMKTKQQVSPEAVENLVRAIDALAGHYVRDRAIATQPAGESHSATEPSTPPMY